jgi:murein tripeptide amidase MpaA
MLLNSSFAAQAAQTAILPPELPWNGKSKSLLLPATDSWATPFEHSGLNQTPRYDETVAWLQNLIDAAPELKRVSLGTTSEGREIVMILASSDRQFSPKDFLASGKAAVLIQACIHPGEPDGKDAGLMLLRDMTVKGSKRDLLEKVNVLFVPILNADGHERSSRFGRINQRGPLETGWRTNARNLNLNRDYAKLDAPETRFIVRAMNQWQPDLSVDLHVTDGADYQYDITWAFASSAQYSPSIASWFENNLEPILAHDLGGMGHLTARYINLIDNLDPTKGLQGGALLPRFSTGYGDIRHFPALLVETHSLKPYAQRVTGTYVLLESALRTAAGDVTALRRAIADDRAEKESEFITNWGTSDQPPEQMQFLGVGYKRSESPISGGPKIEWLGNPITMEIPGPPALAPKAKVQKPAAYWVPGQWKEVIERLRAHGIPMETIQEPKEMAVEMYRILQPKISDEPFEGHINVMGIPAVERRVERFSAGSVRVPVSAPFGDLVCALLEPSSEDSFFSWGFFLEVVQSTEYVEAYVIEPMAEKMLAEDPVLAREFEDRLESDDQFRKNPRARLQWFYQRTPFCDDRAGLYPVAREIKNVRDAIKT